MLRSLLTGISHSQVEPVVFLRAAYSSGVAAEDTRTSTLNNRFLASEALWHREWRKSCSLIAMNYYTPTRWDRGSRPVVTIIYDAQYRTFPQYFSRKKRAWLCASHRRTLKSATRVVLPSEFVRTDLERCYGSTALRRAIVIPIPVDWARLAPPSTARIPVNEVNSGPVILSVCAHYPHKNVECLLRAFAVMSSKSSMSGSRLVLVGQPSQGLVSGTLSYTPGLEQLSRELGILDRVTFTGFVGDQELAEWYSNADLFVLPSLFEGFGLPAVEALGMGLPVVTTSCAAIPETTLGMASYVSDPTDPRELAAVMSEVAAAPDRFRPAPSSTAALRAHYDCGTIARRYLELVE